MAGKRRDKGKLTRPEARVQRSHARLSGRLAIAASPEQRAAASFDALRSAARRSAERGPQALEDASRHMADLVAWINGA